MAKFLCSECGRSFGRPAGLTRHFNYVHGDRGDDEPAQTEELLISFDPFERLTAPLEAELERLNAELADLDMQRLALLKRVGPIRAALGKLRPSPKNASKKKSEPARSVSEQTLALVGGFIDSHRVELADGFLANQLYDRMQQNGGGAPSVDRVRLTLNELHDQGRLRLVRMTQGGGKLFAPIGDV